MKVLIIFSSADIGGAERSLTRMALNNNDSEISYQLSTFGLKGDLSNWVSRSGSKCECFEKKIWKLIRYIYTEKPDAIYIIGFRLSVLLRFIIPFITDSFLVQGVRWNPNSNSRLDKTFSIFERFFGFLLNGYIVNSKSAKLRLNKLVNRNVTLIYNGISKINTDSPIKSKNKNVLTIANLSERKGYEDYLRAINFVVKKIPESQFIFLGKDKMNGKIQKLIIDNKLEKNVKYLGFQENIGKFLQNSEVFVLPSLYGEGCPTSILEAFAFSVPVVAYRIDGIPELISDKKDGLLFKPGDNKGLADGIITLLSEPKRSKEMGVSGHQKVKKGFLLSDMVKNHNAYFLGIK